ncbi:MAG: DUF1513 domain-containing protein [Rhizobiaceae bacterium]|nr:DUF1513 domain-containing protein [Rhizobiaceae bacterium]
MSARPIDRRTFLALAGAAYAMPARALAEEQALFLGARLNAGGHEVAVIDERGRDRLVLPVPARGHSFAIDATRRRAVAFGRAPGRFAVAFDADGRTEPVPIAAQADRHFFGHGVFTPDGRLLLATENDYEAGRGVVGVYDAGKGFERIGELASGGVGPHEVVLLNDGKTLCVANGGILTHPDYGGQKLNLDTMRPGLAYLDDATGELIEQVFLAPELNQLSIRHLALDGRGTVWFGCQYQGDPAARPPLVGRHRRGQEPELFSGPAEALARMDNYVGSMAVDAAGDIVATSSPRGGLVAFWDAATGRHLGSRDLADGCGIAPLGAHHVLATSGRGAVGDLTPGATAFLVEPDTGAPAWDNHLRRLG